MVISLQSLLKSLKYLIVFVALAYTLYRVLGLLDAYVFPVDKYRVPEGSALKVFHEAGYASQEIDTLARRLILFFWYGE